MSSRLKGPQSVLSAIGRAAFVGTAYYAAAQIGFLLKFPGTTPSVLWPPNAILAIALLVTPPSQWWLYLAAAFPVHAVIELSSGFPTLMMVALFFTNCSEALIAAVVVRDFNDLPVRFDS